MFKDHETLKSRYEILVAVDRALPVLQYELLVWNVPNKSKEALSYHIMIDQSSTEAVQYGPKTCPHPLYLPYLDLNSTTTNHTLSSPPLIQIALAPYLDREDHIFSNIIENSENLAHPPIKAHPRVEEKPPDNQSPIPHIMSSDHELKITQAQTRSVIQPLINNLILRFDSEILKSALADLPFLHQTNSLHPLILSTNEGVYLGTTTDLIGHDHTDFLFLNTGIFDLTLKPYSITPATAFV